MPSIPQTSFAFGAVSPTLWRRNDLKWYKQAARDIYNFFPTYWGSVINRPGFFYVNHTKNDGRARLIPFNSGDEQNQNYVLEFGDHYIRFHTVDGTVASVGDPLVPLEVATPYAYGDLARLKYSQVGDVMLLTHPSHPPTELKRYGHQDWKLGTIDYQRWYAPWRHDVTYEKGQRVCGVADSGDSTWEPCARVWECLQGTNTNHDPRTNEGVWWTYREDLSIPRVEFISPVMDRVDPMREWEWVVQAVYPDGSRSIPSFALHSPWDSTHEFRVSISVDHPCELFIYGSERAAYYEIFRGRNGSYGLVGTTNRRDTAGNQYFRFLDDGGDPDMTTQPRTAQLPFGKREWLPFTKYESGDVVVSPAGGVFRCKQTGVSGRAPISALDMTDGAHSPRLADTAYALGDTVVNEGRTFICVQAGVTSASGPGPFSGLPSTSWLDGLTARSCWEDGTVRWMCVGEGMSPTWELLSEGDYYDRWPSVSAVFEQRRVFARTDEQPGRIFLSRPDDYGTFDRALMPKADSPLSFELASLRRQEIRNLASLRYLFTLSNTSEWLVSGAQRGDPIGPDSINAKVYSERGSSWISPLTIGDSIIYIQTYGNVVRELAYDTQKEMLVNSDLSILYRNSLKDDPIVDWTYAEEPYSILWGVQSSGALVSLTYLKEMEVYGWARHGGTGKFISVCSVPGESANEVFAVVERELSGPTTVCTIERMAHRESGNPMFLDGAVRYADFFNPVGPVFTGLGHLNGKTVTVVADGCVYPNQNVVAGELDLTEVLTDPVHYVDIGLPYTGHVDLLDVATESSRVKVVKEVLFEVEASRGLWIGSDIDKPEKFVEWRQRTVSDSYGPIPSYTGTINMAIPGGWGRSGRAVLQFRDPLPVKLLSVTREVEYGGT